MPHRSNRFARARCFKLNARVSVERGTSVQVGREQRELQDHRPPCLHCLNQATRQAGKQSLDLVGQQDMVSREHDSHRIVLGIDGDAGPRIIRQLCRRRPWRPQRSVIGEIEL